MELNGSAEIISLSDDSEADSFSYIDIVCYPCAITEDLSRILTERYSYIILDLGVLTPDIVRDFYKCDVKFIIGSVSPWKSGRFYESLESLLYHTNVSQEHIVILGNLGTKENLRQFEHLCRLPVCAIPVLPNPFQLTTANCTFFQEMLAKYRINIP
jgi:hypothetical protein